MCMKHSLPDAQNPSNSSRTKDDFIQEGRGKRKRKMKLHFDVSGTSIPIVLDWKKE